MLSASGQQQHEGSSEGVIETTRKDAAAETGGVAGYGSMIRPTGQAKDQFDLPTTMVTPYTEEATKRSFVDTGSGGGQGNVEGQLKDAAWQAAKARVCNASCAASAE